MKTIKSLILFTSIILISLYSCKKDQSGSVSNVKKVTYPTITLTGAELISVSVSTTGATYTDAGAVGFDDVANVKKDLKPVYNDVDLSTPGFYSVQYKTTNTNGYESTKSRLILVSAASPASLTMDISGTYARVSNGQEVHVTKKADGIYITDNVGGVANSPAFVAPIMFGITTDSTIVVPLQTIPNVCDVNSEEGKIDLVNSPTTFSYKVVGSEFGTATRVFVKQ